jgi:hypothetical protein
MGIILGNFCATLWLAFKVGQHEEKLKPTTKESE